MVLSPPYVSSSDAEIVLGSFGHHDFPNLSRLVAPASPTGAVLLSRAEVCSLSTVTRGAADVGVVGVNAEPGLKHHHAVIILVTAVWVCEKGQASLIHLDSHSINDGQSMQINSNDIFFEVNHFNLQLNIYYVNWSGCTDQTYLSQLCTAACCILLGSLGSNWGHNGHWEQRCHLGNAPRVRGSHRHTSANTDVTEQSDTGPNISPT